MPANNSFTLDDLRKLMSGCAGIDDSVDLDSDIGNITFDDLGYDSLAVMEITAVLKNELGVAIPEDAVSELPTPRLLTEYVNARLAAA